MSIEGQGHFFTIYFPGFVCFVLYYRPRYQVSVYRTIGPLVFQKNEFVLSWKNFYLKSVNFLFLLSIDSIRYTKL